jgi:ADP-ribose pyrophosphatase YjhB (NUDIX family)
MKKPNEMNETNPLDLVKRVKALADIGLLYADNEYDRERYEELVSISLKLLSATSGQPLSVLHDFFMPVRDYPTPKVDVRGLILNEAHEVLLVKESLDGKWSLPGGWAEVGFSPSEVIRKEIEEETGLDATVVRLLAVYDKKCHPHPPQPLYVYKLVFLCEAVAGSRKPGFDIQDVRYFALEQLPELSDERILASQIRQVYQLAVQRENKVYFD